MKHQRKFIITGILALLMLGGVAVWYFAGRDPQLDEVTSDVAKHMVLPTTETPTLAIVQDQSKLQSSLKKVANTGDRILVYSKTGIVIVYRPSIDRIVSVQPILIGKQANSTLNIGVAVLDGSGNEEALSKFIIKLYEVYPNIRVVEKATAPRNFPETIVFSKNAESGIIDQLAGDLGVKRGIAPLGVSSGSAEVTFIVGADFDGK